MRAIVLFSVLMMFSCQDDLISLAQEYKTINKSQQKRPVLSKERKEMVCCLPTPTAAFISLLESDSLISFRPDSEYGFVTDEIYFYLITHLDSLKRKKVIKVDDFWGPYEWTQKFDSGVNYYHIDYLEVGNGGALYTKCSDKTAFISVIDQVIKDRITYEDWNPDYQWNKDSTRYEPHGEEWGCFYQVKRDTSNFLFLEWTCAC